MVNEHWEGSRIEAVQPRKRQTLPHDVTRDLNFFKLIEHLIRNDANLAGCSGKKMITLF